LTTLEGGSNLVPRGVAMNSEGGEGGTPFFIFEKITIM